MYLLSTTHVILAIQIDYNAFVINRNADEVFNRIGGYPTTLAQLALEFTNCIFADSILIWRLWVLWDRQWTIIVLPICLVIGSAALAYDFVYEISKINSPEANYSDVFARKSEVVGIVYGICTVVTNLLCTGLIAGRIWWHNRQMQLSLGRQMASKRYRAIFFTILESGTIYSMAWIILIILDLCNSNATFPMIDIMAQLSKGIVPALIIVLIARSVDGLSALRRQNTSNPDLSMPRFPGQRTTSQLMTSGLIIEEASFRDNVEQGSEETKV
ncbi:hypothetical protein GYMLUDRAFT_265729 [Collybiopsis luxurians FD-317 M1]|uniref:Uncharacterized protein n=1 Tax=Collybiopsis luxurians FD-317 M1 TaxID=944289 RepID=A0A0D0C1I1_9AGAR|nr:hypothetical protein GYMLUDRAFT_265729 [Collybiopsis luxurians FD-317 M1]